MCGIFGLVTQDTSKFTSTTFKLTVDNLFKLSESRGKEAAGLAILSRDKIKVYKQPIKSTAFINSVEYKNLFIDTFNIDNLRKNAGSAFPIAVIGHARLVTDGAREKNENNQPVIKNSLVGIHNGIIVNDEALWKQFPSMKKEYDVDSEVILSLFSMFLTERKSIIKATQDVFSLIYGTASVAILFNNLDYILLATNNGSLYICTNSDKNVFLFTSEEFFLRKLLRMHYLKKLLDGYEIKHISPGHGCIVNILNLQIEDFSFRETEKSSSAIYNSNRVKDIVDVSPDIENRFTFGKEKLNIQISRLSKLIDQFQQNEQIIFSLERCKKCILPETMPFIEFNKEGVCNYCRNYKKLEPRGVSALEGIIAKYRSKTGKPDCIVGISGGRDSTYGLHYIKTILHMNPIAYTYDWGMITDLARRNISRICGKLGIEHILVSADIIQKRRYIRANVQAWLKKPDLGMVPLFMAGDKQYFYYLNKLKKQTGINLTFMCENLLERTDFKSGFCEVNQEFIDENRVYTLSLKNKIKIAIYYAGQYISNPTYINHSIMNTLSAYAAYYLIRRDYLNIYRFIRWDEKNIIDTLIKEYDWEVAKDTNSTWRIGDGTAPFYNYIYYTVAGFTENDTFRSNQIRHGLISREEALRLVREEHRPRFESIKWYCDTIGIDFEETIKIINKIPKLYVRER